MILNATRDARSGAELAIGPETQVSPPTAQVWAVWGAIHLY